jgi:hypothetical protein
MSSLLLLVQFASLNVALFCGALFAGAATYVTLVEHPAMDEGGTRLADSYILASHPRPAVFQASFGVAGALAAILTGFCGGGPWWIGGGALLGAGVALHVTRVLPLAQQVADLDRSDIEGARALILRMARLHALVALAGLAALCVFILRA